MKRRNISIMACVALMLTMGCSTQERATSFAASTRMVSTSRTEGTSSASSTEGGITAENESTITGIISDIKDFMFTVTGENGVDHTINFEGEKPGGLSSVRGGDAVSAVYTGKPEETEAFTGTMISVTKKQQVLIVNQKSFGLVREGKAVYKEGTAMAPLASQDKHLPAIPAVCNITRRLNVNSVTWYRRIRDV